MILMYIGRMTFAMHVFNAVSRLAPNLMTLDDLEH